MALTRPNEAEEARAAELPEPERLPVVARFAGIFLGVFLTLRLASSAIEPGFVRLHAALGNVWAASVSRESGISVLFKADGQAHPWRVTLVVEPSAPPSRREMRIDLLTLEIVPLSAFLALCAATPHSSRRSKALLAVSGLLLLAPLRLLLGAIPVVLFLGMPGPGQVFQPDSLVEFVLQTAYAAFVAPPGIAYALPLLSWWILLNVLRSQQARQAAR